MSWVPFGATGLKLRLIALGGAALFAGAVFATETLALLFPGVMLYAWLLFAALLALLFFLVHRTTDEGQLEPAFVNALLPWYFWPVGIIWVVMVGEDGPDPFGRWNVFGSNWGGGTLYFLLLASVMVYNLLRMNLRRAFARPR